MLSTETRCVQYQNLCISRREGTLDCKLHLYSKFYNHFSYSLAQKFWVLKLNFDWLVLHYKCQNCSIILIYRKGNFVYHWFINLTSIVLSLKIPGLYAACVVWFQWNFTHTGVHPLTLTNKDVPDVLEG